MSYIVYSFLQILNIAGTRLKKDSKIITLLVLILIWCFFAGDTASADVENYTNYYNKVIMGNYPQNIEVGYLFLQKIGIWIGLNYVHFKMLSIVPCILLIHNTIKKYSDNCHYVYFFYMLYAMFFDVVQIRNFMAISIVIFAIRFLIKDGMQNKVKYIICILLATSIHSASIFYLILIFIKKDKSNIFTKMVICITFIFCLITFINGNSLPFIGQIAQSINSDKISGYLESKSGYGFVFPFCLQIFNFTMIFFARKIMRSSNKEYRNYEINNQKNTINNESENKRNRMSFVDLIFWINFMSFLFLPLYMMSSTFYRMIRNYTILNLIACSLAQNQLRTKPLYRFAFNFIVFTNTCAWLYYDVIFSDNMLRVLKPIFEFNLFL